MRSPTSCLAPLLLALLLGSAACEGRQTTTRTVTTRTVTAQPNAPQAAPAAAPPSQLVRVDSSARTETSTTPGGVIEWLKVVLDFLAEVAWPLVALVGVAIAARHMPKAVPILMARLRRDEVTLQAGSLKMTLSKSKEALAPMEVGLAPAGGAVIGARLDV